MQHLFGGKVRQQFVDIIAVALCCLELSGGDIEERYTDHMFIEMQTGYPVVLFLCEGGVRIADARCYEFGHTAFDEFLRQLRIFQLVAYRYA